MDTELTPRQREIFVAIVLNDVPLYADLVAEDFEALLATVRDTPPARPTWSPSPHPLL